ncbi:LemA family protein [Alkanindiges sp. WGS2144]|uniref:LemA family protein n=1 Tax=Alkanindiges sp. WGS2144 TaxID=3366808 RepID=UPI003752E42D
MSRQVLSTLLLTAVLATTMPGCGYNNLQAKDEAVNASWSEVLNQYQRRADLVPNLVNVVKGYASHEQQVLTEVTNARARVGSMQATPELVNDPEAFRRYQEAQGQLTSALSRLLVVSENYPNLKADTAFRDLSAQLEGTENRITVARNRYITSVQDYNTYVRQLPQSITAKVIGMQPKPNFRVDNEAAVSTAPTVNFDTGSSGNTNRTP